jgi:catechol 2,3-dioxygenase-like lactoylglutathione lyase family enzyme
MSAELNHIILWCRDKMASSAFLAEIIGRPAPVPFGHFMVVDLDNSVSIDFMEKTGPIALQHCAFLIGEADFDAAFARIKAKKLTYWADPGRTKVNQFNTHDGGRGLYFEDPKGHFLEIITRPYGRG